MQTLELVDSCLAPAVDLRRRLHQIPELGFEEFETAALVRAELSRLGIEFVAGVNEAPTATVAWVGDPRKPCVAIRADIDALPIIEQSGVPWTSKNHGKMHACGHDGHTATLCGLAAMIKRIESRLPVCVKFIFQPAEEGGGGAEVLCHAGVLDGRIGPKVAAIFGLHGWPALKIGTVATRAGSLLAATDTFTATFVGRGCHGAFPHVGRDPIVTAAEAVINLQQFVSREMDPTDAAVVTVGKFHAGTATNIIPDRATIEGTLRTLNDGARTAIRRSVQRRCAGIAAANECELNFMLEPGYPATVNDQEMTNYFLGLARESLGLKNVAVMERPVMGGEDFAYYLEKVPGCFFMVGTCPADRDSYPVLHSDGYDFSDPALAVGMRLFHELVMNWRG